MTKSWIQTSILQHVNIRPQAAFSLGKIMLDFQTPLHFWSTWKSPGLQMKIFNLPLQPNAANHTHTCKHITHRLSKLHNMVSAYFGFTSYFSMTARCPWSMSRLLHQTNWDVRYFR